MSTSVGENQKGDFDDDVKQSSATSSDHKGTKLSSQSAHSAEFLSSGITTTRSELWAYTAYYMGNTGLSGFVYGPSQFQNILSLAATCDASKVCTLPFAGRRQSIEAIVLNVNGISFAIQCVIFLFIGAWADYGTWRPRILLTFTAIGIAISFGWLGVEGASKWEAAVFLYLAGLICAQCAITFWAAAYPGLARDTPEMKQSQDLVASGARSAEEHELEYSLIRSRILNSAYIASSVATLVTLAVMVGILKALKVDSSKASNTKAFSVLIALAGGLWLLFSLPWFIVEQRRPGLALPPGRSFGTIGFYQVIETLQKCLQLKQASIYFIFYLCISVLVRPAITVVSTIQYRALDYSTLQITYMTMLFYGSQALGIRALWMVQKRFRLSNKTMLTVIALAIVLMSYWGLVGIWTNRFGFHRRWELWVWQFYHGFFVSPWYSYSQTMISEVTPDGQEFLWFSLFAIAGKVSAFVGPLVSSAITDDTVSKLAKYNMPFTFFVGLGSLSLIFLPFIDVTKSREECRKYALKSHGNQEKDIRSDA